MTTTHQWGTQPEMFGPRHEHRLSMIVREVDRLGTSVILDAAVGLGQLSTRLRQHGHVVFGLDYSFDAALHARRQGITTVVGDMTKLPFRDEAFEAVTTGETLEHLDDDASAAREIGRVVASGGHVVATVPALRSLWSASDDYYEHRRRYSREQLVALFREKFTIEKAKFWGFPIVLAYDTLFLLPMNKRRARKRVDEDAALRSIARAGRARAAVRIVRAVFSLDRLFEWIPFGPGLLLVARRR
ncbi:MAG TPA: class I SAM-dependent methyltransferase [Thermoanaerobaculia bacterium]